MPPARFNSGQVSSWGNPAIVPPSPINVTTGYLGAATSTNTGTMQENGFVAGAPVYLPNGIINEIAFKVTVAGSAGSVVRLGVFSLVGNVGNLVVDAGTIDGTSATTQSITGLTVPIRAGWYLLCASSQGSPATRPQTHRVNGILPFTAVSRGNADQQIVNPAIAEYFFNGASGAFPATITFDSVGGGARPAPRVVVKGTWTI